MYVSPNVVVGFHGCDEQVFNHVIKEGGHLKPSQNQYDWLGHGKYFWEGSYERALVWAQHSKTIKSPAVVGAFIKLGNCIDLLDLEDLTKVKHAYDMLCLEFEAIGKALPKNRVHVGDVSFVRELDCQVILRLQQLVIEEIVSDLGLPDAKGQNLRKVQHHPAFIDSVRGMFPEGGELYAGAGFREKNHIQLCVVNPNCIMGYFNPTKPNSWYKKV